jgi:transcriptional regulator with XRE-family HTH domain
VAVPATHGTARDAVACFARNLASARRRAELTQEQLSDLSGVHPTEVSRIVCGQAVPSLDPADRVDARQFAGDAQSFVIHLG